MRAKHGTLAERAGAHLKTLRVRGSLALGGAIAGALVLPLTAGSGEAGLGTATVAKHMAPPAQAQVAKHMAPTATAQEAKHMAPTTAGAILAGAGWSAPVAGAGWSGAGWSGAGWSGPVGPGPKPDGAGWS